MISSSFWECVCVLDVLNKEIYVYYFFLSIYLPIYLPACLDIMARGGSGNSFGEAGWAAVLAGAEGCVGLVVVDGFGVAGLMTGGLEALELVGFKHGGGLSRGDEGLAAAMMPYLRRSASRLTWLDLRCGASSGVVGCAGCENWVADKEALYTACDCGVVNVVSIRMTRNEGVIKLRKHEFLINNIYPNINRGRRSFTCVSEVTLLHVVI